MAHKEQIDYVNRVRNQFPQFFTNKKVLGIGTFNVCGTENEYFTDCDYQGLDLGPGPGVDIVCPAQECLDNNIKVEWLKQGWDLIEYSSNKNWYNY